MSDEPSMRALNGLQGRSLPEKRDWSPERCGGVCAVLRRHTNGVLKAERLRTLLLVGRRGSRLLEVKLREVVEVGEMNGLETSFAMKGSTGSLRLSMDSTSDARVCAAEMSCFTPTYSVIGLRCAVSLSRSIRAVRGACRAGRAFRLRFPCHAARAPRPRCGRRRQPVTRSGRCSQRRCGEAPYKRACTPCANNRPHLCA